jgi:hypothetical protein
LRLLLAETGNTALAENPFQAAMGPAESVSVTQSETPRIKTMFHLHNLIQDQAISAHIRRNMPHSVRGKPCLPGWNSSLKGVPMIIEPRSQYYGRVGRAFRYLLWFELQRRYPDVCPPHWVADDAPALIRDRFKMKPLAAWTEGVLRQAHEAVHNHLSIRRVTRALEEQLASLTYQLARLDFVCCYVSLSKDLETVDPQAIEDLQALLSGVPFEVLTQGKPILLGPPLGQHRDIVCGAHLITGDRLINFLTTKQTSITSTDYELLVASFVLARDQRRHEPGFPVVNNLGLYLSRHGYLLELDTAEWMSSPSFVPFEQGLLEQIQQARATALQAATSITAAQPAHATQGRP